MVVPPAHLGSAGCFMAAREVCCFLVFLICCQRLCFMTFHVWFTCALFGFVCSVVKEEAFEESGPGPSCSCKQSQIPSMSVFCVWFWGFTELYIFLGLPLSGDFHTLGLTEIRPSSGDDLFLVGILGPNASLPDFLFHCNRLLLLFTLFPAHTFQDSLQLAFLLPFLADASPDFQRLQTEPPGGHRRRRFRLGRRPHEGRPLRHLGQRSLCGGERDVAEEGEKRFSLAAFLRCF